MNNYSIKKTTNGEFKEISKHYILNVNKFCSHKTTLHFDVENEDNPFCIDMSTFYTMTISQIQQGLVENLSYDNGIFNIVTRDGNTIKYSTYDFSLNDFNSTLQRSALEELRLMLYKIVSLYKENPNRAVTTTQRCIRLIMDIIDGDRKPIIEDKDELLRVFEVYNANKKVILAVLLENVVFYDDNGSVLNYGKRLRVKKLNQIKYDVFNQMEISMLLFAASNDAVELYQNYVSQTYIPRREIVYKYVDQEGNEITPPVEEESPGTIFSFGKSLIQSSFHEIKEFAAKKKEKRKEKRRTK